MAHDDKPFNFWDLDDIRLRAIEERDIPAVIAWEKDTQVAEYMDFLWAPQSPTAIRKWVEKETVKRMEGDGYFWIIEDRHEQVVGQVSTRCTPRHGHFEYGVSIVHEHRRKGYAGRAIMKVVEYYFDKLRYQKVTASVHSDNPGSMALHRALGFQHEGTLRNMIYRNGGYVDLHYFGLTDEEFRRGNQNG